MSIVSKLVDKFDDKSSSFADVDAFSSESDWISTGSPSLDYQLKTLGLPTGIIEVRGESQSGKTTASLMLMLQSQRQFDDNVIITILSSERRDNKAYAKQIGINVDNIIVHKVTTIEDVSNKVHSTVERTLLAIEEHLSDQVADANPKLKKGADAFKEKLEEAKKEFGQMKFVFIWDALGQTVSSQELAKAKLNAQKGETNQAALGSAARALGMTLRSMVGLKDEHPVWMFIINRPYDKVDGTPGKKSYGGKAIELYPTMRLELARIQGIKVGDDEVGQVTQVHTIKNDFDAPRQKFNIEIGYGLGYVLNSDDIEMGIEAGFLEKHGQGGAIFKLGKKELKWKTRRELYALYSEREPMLFILIKKLTKYAHEKVIRERQEKEDKWKTT